MKKRQAKKILKLKDKLNYRESLIKQAEAKMSTSGKRDDTKKDEDKDNKTE